MGVLGEGWPFATSIFALCLTLPAFAAAGDLREEVFQDWRVVCQADAGQTRCQMLQSARAGDMGPEVFLLSISPGKDASYGVVSVPLGVYLAPGIEMHVDRRRPFKLLYEVCDQASCHGGFALSGPILSAFQKGITAKVRVWTGKARAVEFPVSLRGFSAAWRYYQAEIAG
jgi:invasion protein IalB